MVEIYARVNARWSRFGSLRIIFKEAKSKLASYNSFHLIIMTILETVDTQTFLVINAHASLEIDIINHSDMSSLAIKLFCDGYP